MKKFTHTKSGSAGFVPPRRRKGAPAAAGGTTKSGRTAPREKPRVGRISDEAMRDCLAASGVTVSPQVLPRLVTYVHMLMTWNRVMNLVGQETWQDAAGLLVADSFYLAPFLESLPLPGDPRVLDLGAGAGLPGIPLRLLWPEGSYTMIEKRQKRAMFLIQACGTLHLKKTDVQAVPAETYFASHAPCDLIVSRAFMPWRELLSFIDAALLPGGFAVFMMNDPLPPDVPEGWIAHSSKSYSVRGHVRYLWALRRGEN